MLFYYIVLLILLLIFHSTSSDYSYLDMKPYENSNDLHMIAYDHRNLMESKSSSSPIATDCQYKYHIYHPFQFEQCIVNSHKDPQCIENNKFGMRTTIACRDILFVNMNHTFNWNIFLTSLYEREKSKSSFPMIIKITISRIDINSTVFHSERIENEIDDFLTQRPWYKLSKDTIAHGKSYGESVIIFESYLQHWWPYLHYLVQTQFLRPQECLTSPIAVVRNDGIHPGIGASLYSLASTKTILPYAVLSYYLSQHINAFVSPNDCSKSNLWDCCFLPLTNCSIPDIVTNCHQEDCLGEQTKGLYGSALYDYKSAYHPFIETIVNKSAELIGILPLLHHKIIPKEHLTPPPFKYVLPKVNLKFVNSEVLSSQSLLTFLLITRPTAFYRRKIKKLIHDMTIHTHSQHHHLSPWTSETPCIAAHIRRGDKVKVSVNMTEWCANWTYDRNPSNFIKKGCFNIYSNHLIPEFDVCPSGLGEALNFGCMTVPYSAIKLTHVLDKVSMLINTTIVDVIILTDDIIDLEREIRLLTQSYSQYRIHTFKSSKLPLYLSSAKSSGKISEIENEQIIKQYRTGTDSGIGFFASLQLAQRCSGFIGHFGSVVSNLLYKSMCIQHAGRYGVCPPVYDFDMNGLL